MDFKYLGIKSTVPFSCYTNLKTVNTLNILSWERFHFNLNFKGKLKNVSVNPVTSTLKTQSMGMILCWSYVASIFTSGYFD